MTRSDDVTDKILTTNGRWRNAGTQVVEIIDAVGARMCVIITGATLTRGDCDDSGGAFGRTCINAGAADNRRTRIGNKRILLAYVGSKNNSRHS